MTLKINTKAPNFKLPSTSKDNYSLKESIGKYVIIYFYPKDDTPGCTIETNDFNKLLSKFKKLECDVYGISKDNLKSHDKFRDKYKIKFDLLADEELTLKLQFLNFLQLRKKIIHSKILLVNLWLFIFIKKMTLRDALSKLMILINYLLNLKS